MESLIEDEMGVTDWARSSLMNEGRVPREREFTIVKITGEIVPSSGTFLSVWCDYAIEESHAELWVKWEGVNKLIHRRQHPDKVGFTPFAKDKLLYPTGHAKDVKHRTYVMGGKDPSGHRVRREVQGTLLIAWMDYAAHTELTHMWVKWKDGKRHLVHRKGALT